MKKQSLAVLLVLTLSIGINAVSPARMSAAATLPPGPATHAPGDRVMTLRLHLSPADRMFAEPDRVTVAVADTQCESVVQEEFRWVSAAIMANGLPIIAYNSRRPYVPGGEPDEDGFLHPRTARYLSENAIAEPLALDDPSIVGRSNGYDNESSIDVATNGPGGLILAIFIDPVRYRFVVRRSTDLGRTWSPIQVIPGLGWADPYSGTAVLHQLYYDTLSGLFYLAFVTSYLTSADGVTWSPLHSWGQFHTSNGSNYYQSRVARYFRTKAGTWIAYGNLYNSNDNMGVARFGNGVCDTLACWPTQQIQLWHWRVGDTVPPTQEERSMLHTPGTAFYLPASSTPDRIHLVFGATALTGFRSVPQGHLFHWWSDDDGRTWRNENGSAGGQGFDTDISGAADAETPIPEPPGGPLADIDAAWVPSFGDGGQLVVWGVEGNNNNDGLGLDVSLFGDGQRDQTRVQGADGYGTCANTPPTLALPGDQRIFLHDGIDVSGSFTDPDPDQTWSATAEYGDGTGSWPVTMAADKTFALQHRYADPGDFAVAMTVADSAGASTTATFRVSVDFKRLILYVHGTGGSFRSKDFPVLRSPLETRYEVQSYEYYEDRGNATSESGLTCQAGRQRSVPAFDAPAFADYDFWPDAPDPAPGICDSNDDLELNGVLLNADIARHLHDFDRVTLVSNSGGAAIVRAYLAYAAAAGTGTPAGVDLVVSLEGVQQGSYLAAALFAGGDLARQDRPIDSWVRDRLFGAVASSRPFGVDPQRPVVQDVLPLTAFQAYVARAAAIPDEPHYLNVAGDLRVNVHYAFLFWEFRGPDRVELGDFVMLPGPDDPVAAPTSAPLGGARFLPSVAGRGRSSGQWILRRDFDVWVDTFSSSDPIGALAGGVAVAAGDPAMHLNLARMDEICVRVPPSLAPRRLHQALIDAIGSLDRGKYDPTLLGFGTLSRVDCP